MSLSRANDFTKPIIIKFYTLKEGKTKESRAIVEIKLSQKNFEILFHEESMVRAKFDMLKNDSSRRSGWTILHQNREGVQLSAGSKTCYEIPVSINTEVYSEMAVRAVVSMMISDDFRKSVKKVLQKHERLECQALADYLGLV
jgi:hypothetical protein